MNIEPLILIFVTNDSLWILLITLMLSMALNVYLRRHISWLYRLLPIWLFAYIFSLEFVSLYSDWLGVKVDSYADSAGFIFTSNNDELAKSPEFAIYLEASNHNTWRNMYFITGIIFSLIITIMVEVFVSMIVKVRKYLLKI